MEVRRRHTTPLQSFAVIVMNQIGMLVDHQLEQPDGAGDRYRIESVLATAHGHNVTVGVSDRTKVFQAITCRILQNLQVPKLHRTIAKKEKGGVIRRKVQL